MHASCTHPFDRCEDREATRCKQQADTHNNSHFNCNTSGRAAEDCELFLPAHVLCPGLVPSKKKSEHAETSRARRRKKSMVKI